MKKLLGPLKLFFGSKGGSDWQPMILTNPNDIEITIESLSVVGDFIYKAPKTPMVLKPFESFSVDILFLPNTLGLHTGSVTVKTRSMAGNTAVQLFGYTGKLEPMVVLSFNTGEKTSGELMQNLAHVWDEQFKSEGEFYVIKEADNGVFKLVVESVEDSPLLWFGTLYLTDTTGEPLPADQQPTGFNTLLDQKQGLIKSLGFPKAEVVSKFKGAKWSPLLVEGSSATQLNIVNNAGELGLKGTVEYTPIGSYANTVKLTVPYEVEVVPPTWYLRARRIVVQDDSFSWITEGYMYINGEFVAKKLPKTLEPGYVKIEGTDIGNAPGRHNMFLEMYLVDEEGNVVSISDMPRLDLEITRISGDSDGGGIEYLFYMDHLFEEPISETRDRLTVTCGLGGAVFTIKSKNSNIVGEFTLDLGTVRAEYVYETFTQYIPSFFDGNYTGEMTSIDSNRSNGNALKTNVPACSTVSYTEFAAYLEQFKIEAPVKKLSTSELMGKQGIEISLMTNGKFGYAYEQDGVVKKIKPWGENKVYQLFSYTARNDTIYRSYLSYILDDPLKPFKVWLTPYTIESDTVSSVIGNADGGMFTIAYKYLRFPHER